MIEFRAEDGGRYTFSDDLINLQDLALSVTGLFDGCGDFVLSGCRRSGDTVTPGYVWLDGKVRRYPGALVARGSTFSICAADSEEKVPYASGESGAGRSVYGCAGMLGTPGNGVKYVEVTEADKGNTVKDKLFGRYCLLLDPASGSQRVAGETSFDQLRCEGYLRSDKGLSVFGGGSERMRVSCGSSGVMRMEEFASSKNSFIEFGERGVAVGSGGVVGLTVTDGFSRFDGGVEMPSLMAEDIEADSLCAAGTELSINRSDTNAKSVTVIGDGSDGVMMTLDGRNGVVEVSFPLAFTGSDGVVARYMMKDLKPDSSLVTWGSSSHQYGYMGYTVSGMEDSLTAQMVFNNAMGSIKMDAKTAIYLNGRVYENNELLQNRYAAMSGGLAQFLSTYTMAQLREQIGAASLADAAGLSEGASGLAAQIAAVQTSLRSEIDTKVEDVREEMWDALDRTGENIGKLQEYHDRSIEGLSDRLDNYINSAAEEGVADAAALNAKINEVKDSVKDLDGKTAAKDAEDRAALETMVQTANTALDDLRRKCENTYATYDGGLAQFMRASDVDASVLRGQIQAASVDDVTPGEWKEIPYSPNIKVKKVGGIVNIIGNGLDGTVVPPVRWDFSPMTDIPAPTEDICIYVSTRYGGVYEVKMEKGARVVTLTQMHSGSYPEGDTYGFSIVYIS